MCVEVVVVVVGGGGGGYLDSLRRDICCHSNARFISHVCLRHGYSLLHAFTSGPGKNPSDWNSRHDLVNQAEILRERIHQTCHWYVVGRSTWAIGPHIY